MIKKLRRRLTIILSSLTGGALALLLGFLLFNSIGNLAERNTVSFDNEITRIMQAMSYYANSTAFEQTINEQTSLPAIEKSPYIISIKFNGKFLNFDDGWNINEDRKKLHKDAIATSNTSMDTVIFNKDADVVIGGGFITDAPPPAQIEESKIQTEYYSNTLSPFEEYLFKSNEVEVYSSEDVAMVSEGVYTDEPSVSRASNFFNRFFKRFFSNSDYEIFEAMYPTINSSTTNNSYRTCYIPFYPVFNGGQVDEYPMEIIILEDLSFHQNDILMLCLRYLAMFLLCVCILVFASWLLARIVVKPTAKAMQHQADFIAAASHELRSPLAVISSSLSAASGLPEDKALKYYNTAKKETKRMGKLVNDLLLLAGGDAQNWNAQLTPVDLDTLLIEASEKFTPIAAEKGISLKLSLPNDTLPNVLGDKHRLNQILSILLDNALQYAPKKSDITIKAYEKKKSVAIEVVDHGKGIEKEDLENIFDRFYRADKSRTDKNHFGLGLSVAKELAALHSATLTASETQGGGATFHLLLPTGKA